MKEIEVKILEVNPAEVRKKLNALGAEKFFEGDVHIVLLDFPDKRLEKAGTMLRLRKAGDRIELCFKGKREPSVVKVREETEVLTTDFGNTLALLKSIGLHSIYEGRKHRECYRLGNVKFDMDTYKDVPTYLEVEAPTEKEVKEYVEKLGFTMAQTSALSAFELEKYYKTKPSKHL